MRAKSAILLLLALGCGLVAAIGVTQVISKNPEPAQQGDTRSILVAVKDIKPGELIAPQMVKLEPWPKDRAPADSLTEIGRIEGCRARDDIYEGAPIRERQLLGHGFTRQTASDSISKGYRVVGVKVDMVSGAGLIQPGDRVDVLVHFSKNESKGVPENRTQTILQDIKVFAVDDTFKLDPAGTDEDTIRAKVIQLLVTPQQAETIVLAQQLGKVQLTMRPPGGEDVIKTPGKTPAELLGMTSVGNRSQEGTSMGSSGSLLDFLSGKKTQASPVTSQPALPTQPSVWNIRILSGAEVTDVTMEEATDPSGEHVWRIGLGGVPAADQSSPLDIPIDGSTPASEPERGDAAPVKPSE